MVNAETMKSKFTIPIYTLLSLLALTVISSAIQRHSGEIFVIVNDEVISVFDVNQRINLFFATSGITRTHTNIQDIKPQIIETLISEKLKLQEAKEHDTEVSEQEIKDTIAQMIARQNFNDEKFQIFLEQNNINIETMQHKIKVDIAWRKLVELKLSYHVSISESKIEETFISTQNNINQINFKLNEIFFLTNNAQEIKDKLKIAQKIAIQLQNQGDFESVARQFSHSASSSKGGHIGWVTETQLESPIYAIVKDMEKGDISLPIKTDAGIYIIQMVDRQETGGINLMRNQFDIMILSFDHRDPLLTNQIARIKKDFKTCKHTQKLAEEKGNIRVDHTGLIPFSNLSEKLQPIIQLLEKGDISPAITKGDTTNLFIICDRKNDLGIQISRDNIANNLYAQQMSMMARRYLRKLRYNAVIEYH